MISIEETNVEIEWICCPYCGKNQFPIGNETKIENLIWKCKNSKCKKDFVINTPI